MNKYLAGVVAFACMFGLSNVWASPAEEAMKEYDQALSRTPNLENGKKVYKICAVCHTPEGWGRVDGTYPQLAGQLNTVIIKQLADIRARNRDNPTMRPFTSSRLLGGVQEIADVAAYIAQLPMTPTNGRGSGMDLEHGEKLYVDNCVECHSEHGEGNRKEHIPMIQGQHYRYLMRQFEWIRTGRRRNADSSMVKQIRRFTARDVAAVMDYVSRLVPPPGKLAEQGWVNPDFPSYSRANLPRDRGNQMPLPGVPPRYRPGQYR
ncbi:c-type cytochrome [Candidatus Endoriftia persephone]|jgi:cytochrome c553|uniref:Cytochrome c class I n=2 Tax=Gammaproteobacteria TaxID=1236 RepID=G2DEF5_9GAMM|nr:c-type cytochrome [Candidatus Endoriftia persephone]EGV51009.1 cytochrome c class I [endosymbiont of Riftia pachyptila (vent Ph05)]USF87133.1 c-type cytochrome [Candidatus Endoriftia persephone]